jgi:hypothetical protein
MWSMPVVAMDLMRRIDAMASGKWRCALAFDAGDPSCFRGRVEEGVPRRTMEGRAASRRQDTDQAHPSDWPTKDTQNARRPLQPRGLTFAPTNLRVAVHRNAA